MDRIYRDRVRADLAKYFERFELKVEPWVSAEETMEFTPERISEDALEIIEKRCRLAYKVGIK